MYTGYITFGHLHRYILPLIIVVIENSFIIIFIIYSRSFHNRQDYCRRRLYFINTDAVAIILDYCTKNLHKVIFTKNIQFEVFVN